MTPRTKMRLIVCLIVMCGGAAVEYLIGDPLVEVVAVGFGGALGAFLVTALG